MAAKTKLRHKTATGLIETRTTARPYTHVVVFQGRRTDDRTEEQWRAEYTYFGDPARRERAVEWRIREAAFARHNAQVYSWHESAANAEKQAAQCQRGCLLNVAVEEINGGERR